MDLMAGNTGRDVMIVGVIPPPPGVTPNFDHSPSRQGLMLGINVACLVFAFAFVSMRLWTKTYLTRSVGWDDCKFACLAS